jgi:hypothetical protein
MLIAFFKSHEDKDCDCKIAKFVDRIWIDKSGNLICIRTMIIHVVEGSNPLHEIRMLTPFRQLPEFEDLSETCLSSDYLFNNPHFSSGGYEINRLDIDRTYGLVFYDYFRADVFTNNLIKSFDSPISHECKVFSIKFKNPILPGTFRLIRTKFKITSVLDEIFPRIYNLKLEYFHKDLFQGDYNTIASLEIYAIKLFNIETKQGGFDVFVHLPKNFSGSNFNALTQTTGRQLHDGSLSNKVCQKFIWRARELFPPEIEYLRAGDTPFAVEGLLNDPYELEEIRGNINYLKGGLKKAKRNSIIAICVAVFFGLMAIFRNYLLFLITKYIGRG